MVLSLSVHCQMGIHKCKTGYQLTLAVHQDFEVCVSEKTQIIFIFSYIAGQFFLLVFFVTLLSSI